MVIQSAILKKPLLVADEYLSRTFLQPLDMRDKADGNNWTKSGQREFKNDVYYIPT